jgi:hypothetical protein
MLVVVSAAAVLEGEPAEVSAPVAAFELPPPHAARPRDAPSTINSSGRAG